MKVRRLAAAMSGLAIVAATPMAAAAAPAPPGVAEAAVAQIGSLLGVSTTSAQAGPTGTSSSAAPISVGGQPLLPQTGGSQTGPGTSHNALIDTGTTPLGQVQVTPWSASNTGSHAEADAAVARANVLDVAQVDAPQSHSSADWSDTNSSGQSSSDGATVHLGGPVDGLDVVLLHSEGDSAGTSGSFVAGINDTKLLTSDDAAEACDLTVPNLLDLNCLAASGGPGSVLASIADLTVGGIAGLPVVEAGVVTASASGSSATTDDPTDPTGPRGVLNESSSRSLLGSAGDPAGVLAFTGATVGTIFLIGLVFIGLGGAVLAIRRPWAALRPLPATAA